MTHYAGDDTSADPLAFYDYVFDHASRIDEVETNDGNTDFGYDAAGQLTSASDPVQSLNFSYDRNGNRVDGGNYVMDPSNRLVEDPIYDYDYDDEGNLTKRTKEGTNQTVDYTWDYRNRLTEVLFKAGSQQQERIEYGYDPLDRRISKAVYDASDQLIINSVEYYVYDDAGNLALTFDANGDLKHRYLHGPSIDQILAREDAQGDVVWPLADHLGTVRELAEYDAGSTSITQQIKYDAFGNILDVQDGNGGSQPLDAIDLLFAFTGREWDKDAGLYNYRARWYDPETGRFMSEDPIGFGAEDRNLYRYVGNDPVNRTDPSGLRQAIPRDDLFRQLGGYGGYTAGSTPRSVPDLAGNPIVSTFTQPNAKSLASASLYEIATSEFVVGLGGEIGLAPAARDIGPVSSSSPSLDFLAPPPVQFDVHDLGVVTDTFVNPVNGKVYQQLETSDGGFSFRELGGPTIVPENPSTLGLAIDAAATFSGAKTIAAAGRAARTGARVVGSQFKDVFVDLALDATAGPSILSAVPWRRGGAALRDSVVAPNPAARTRLPQDVSVNPIPPAAKPLNRNVGRSTTQNARAQRDAARLQRAGAQDVRINQQQVNAGGERVGINRPDLQYTNPRTGQRVTIEYERTGSTRGAAHRERILANDPSARVLIRENSN